MKRRLLLPVLVFAFACNNAENREEAPGAAEPEPADNVVNTAPEAASTFPELFRFLQRQDNRFSPERFAEAEVDASRGFVQTPIDTATLRPFEPYLVYSPSREYAIDAVSSNFVVRPSGGKNMLVEGGPDTEVALVHFPKNKRYRLHHSGAGAAFLDARWESDSSFLVAIAQAKGDSILPEVRRYFINRTSFTLYQYPAAVRANIGGYAEGRLNDTTRAF